MTPYAPSETRHQVVAWEEAMAIEQLGILLATGVAAICGALAGRVFALEGDNRRTSILAAAYCGAGSGLVSGPLVAFPIVLIGIVLDPERGIATALLRAGEAIGPALLWGVAGGAVGGLAVGIPIALFKRYAPR
jgi:hypothetical protein